MKEKLKKQRRKIILTVTSILLLVWLTVSVVFSVIAFQSTKKNLLSNEGTYFKRLSTAVSSYEQISYPQLASDLDITVEHWDRMIMLGTEDEPQRTSGADGYHDSDMQIVLNTVVIPENYEDLYESELEPERKLIYDTDKSVTVNFDCIDKETHYDVHGIMDYDELRASISDEQYKTISEYLNKEIDDEGYFYELMCTQFYFRGKDSRILPKTVEIVKTHEDHIWYAEDEVIETFELSPQGVEDKTVHKIIKDTRNVIEGQFVLGNNSSGGLIKDPLSPINYDTHDPYNGNVEQLSLFEYIYSNESSFLLRSVGYEEDYIMDALFSVEGLSSIDPQVLSTEYFTMKYAKRINVLNECIDTILYGTLIAFAFLLIIGIVLTMMLNKIVKTQLYEEEKRREVTNALAHDIKTPLFIISGYAQNLQENINTDKREHYSKRIIERTNEVNELIHKMLDFSNIDNIEQNIVKEDIKLNDIITGAASDFETLSNSKKININVADECIINADKKLISRAISYLLDNAVRYCDDNTEIDISIFKDSFSISNVCSTITNDDVKHILEPYYKADKNRNTKGNGLGLSIVKSIIDMHSFKLDTKLENNIITFTVSFHK